MYSWGVNGKIKYFWRLKATKCIYNSVTLTLYSELNWEGDFFKKCQNRSLKFLHEKVTYIGITKKKQ